MGKVLILSAPSGSGKSTICAHLLEKHHNLELSISATTRKKRGQEENGKDYYFISTDEFHELISKDAFVEWEEVYEGNFYGTLKTEVERIWDKGNIAIFDIDVVGGLNIKKIYGDDALSLFITAPSVEELNKRLLSRNTDTQEAIERRLKKAEFEMSFRSKFDKEVINASLEKAFSDADFIVEEFIQK
ncbi:MAG: guanylate kinase [Rikenellaceae bacterium]